MIRVSTPSRLHFGLLAPVPPLVDRQPKGSGRRFGSVGLMVEAPGIELSLEPADQWSVEGPLAERAGTVLHRLLSQGRGKPQRIQIHHAAPEHKGLGTGTQLALALAWALAETCGGDRPSAVELARWVGRGARSALGIHGFQQGGFLVDGGKASHSCQGAAAVDTIAPLVARVPFPESWRIVLVVPPWKLGRHGREEVEAFAQLKACSQEQTDALCRLTLLGMLPALIDGEFDDFSASLYEFNRLAGEAFRPVQGGSYASPQIAELIQAVRSLGIQGVGQSSWGPTVFAVTPDQEQALWLREQLQERYRFAPHEVLATPANNQGARLERE